MTDKAYIVANKEQEFDVLNKLEQNGMLWERGEKPTDWLPSEKVSFEIFPYTLIEQGYIAWSSTLRNKDRKIVYDGRKEGKKYKVTQDFVNELIKWRDDNSLETKTGYMYESVDGDEIQLLPDIVDIWWTASNNSIERNNRLIAIIQWLNGEDVFEVEAPHKFVVRSNEPDYDGDYWYVLYHDGSMHTVLTLSKATKFDAREIAKEWANSHQVVVEIDEEGNEV